jgi:hypothetical protein
VAEVTLRQFVDGKCGVLNCSYNEEGYCANDDYEFSAQMLAEIIHRKNITDDYIECTGADQDESICEYCGVYYRTGYELEEFWGAIVRRPVVVCEC